MRVASSRLGEQLQRLPDAVADGDALGQLLDRRDRFLVAVAQREQRVEDVGRRRRRAGARRRRCVRSAPSLSLSSSSRRSAVFLPMPGILVSRPASCIVTACASSATDRPDSTDSAVRAPTPLILSSWRNARRSLLGAEAEQQVRVLAHDEVREQRDALAGRRAGCRTCSSARRPRSATPCTSSRICGGFFSTRMPVRRPIMGARESVAARLSHARMRGAGAVTVTRQRREMRAHVVQRRAATSGSSGRAASRDGGCRSGTMIGVMPAASAPRTPGSESSSTTQCGGASRRAARAASRKMSGAGLPRATSSPPTSAAKRGSERRCARASPARASRRVDVATALGMRCAFEPVEQLEQARLERDAFALDDRVVGDVPARASASSTG